MPLNPRSAAHLVARAQELVDGKPAEAVHALEWSVAAYFLGDATALAIQTLRDDASHGRP
jgi:hypothetical protein